MQGEILADLSDLYARMPQDLRSQLKSIRFSQLNPSSYDGRPVFTDWSTDKAISEGLKISVWVYACVYRIAKSAAAVPWFAEKKRGGKWVPVEDSPLLDLVENPNPFWSRQDYQERLAMHLHLGGNGLITKVRPSKNAPPAELWLINPDKIKPIPDSRSVVSGYEVLQDGVPFRVLPPEDVIHVMFTDPSDPYWGLAPLHSAARAVDTDVSASKWQKASMDNRAVADGILSFGEPLTVEQHAHARQQIRDQHQGVDNARLPWVLGSDASWTSISSNPVEMDYVRSRRFNRVEICSAFGVPPPVVGILEDATLANIKTSWEIFWLGTVIPYLDDIRSAFNRGLAPEFGKNLRINYDLSKVEALKSVFREDVDTATKLWMMGVPFNDCNDRLGMGFGPIPFGDVSFVPVNMMPAELVVNPPAMPAAEIAAEEATAAKALRELKTEVTKKLNGSASIVNESLDKIGQALQLDTDS